MPNKSKWARAVFVSFSRKLTILGMALLVSSTAHAQNNSAAQKQFEDLVTQWTALLTVTVCGGPSSLWPYYRKTAAIVMENKRKLLDRATSGNIKAEEITRVEQISKATCSNPEVENYRKYGEQLAEYDFQTAMMIYYEYAKALKKQQLENRAALSLYEKSAADLGESYSKKDYSSTLDEASLLPQRLEQKKAAAFQHADQLIAALRKGDNPRELDIYKQIDAVAYTEFRNTGKAGSVIFSDSGRGSAKNYLSGNWNTVSQADIEFFKKQNIDPLESIAASCSDTYFSNDQDDLKKLIPTQYKRTEGLAGDLAVVDKKMYVHIGDLTTKVEDLFSTISGIDEFDLNIVSISENGKQAVISLKEDSGQTLTFTLQPYTFNFLELIPDASTARRHYYHRCR